MRFLNTEKNRKAVEFISVLVSIILLLLKWCDVLDAGDDVFLFLPASAALVIMGLERAGVFPQEISVEVIATGYVYNFLIPLLKYEESDKKLYIFRPGMLRQINSNELKAMDRLMQNSDEWEYKETDIANPENRRLIIRHGKNKISGKEFYFDYAVTLSSLSALIEYRYEKKKGTRSDAAKNALFNTYTGTFHALVKKELGDLYSSRTDTFVSIEDLQQKIRQESRN